MSKVMQLEDVIAQIKDGDAVATCMAGNIGQARYLIHGLEQSFLETGSPKNLTKISQGGHISDSMFAHEGMITRFIGAHPGPCRQMMALINDKKCEAYGMPQGVMQQLLRCIAAKQPGVLSKIGMGTYVDPRVECGRLNDASPDELMEIVTINGEDWILYKSFPIDIAFIRGGIADEDGNASIDSEALKMEILELATATKSCGGKVFVQVKNVVAKGTINPKDIVVPGEVVDGVVRVPADQMPAMHMQTNVTAYNPYFSGELKAPMSAIKPPPEVLEAVDILCRRAVYELCEGDIINVGLGVGVATSEVAAVEGMTDKVTFTLELGAFGGIPVPMPDFGAALNPVSFIAHPSMFDFYHAGGLDTAFLGLAEVDVEGNVNVSRYGEITAGRAQGGFIDISQCAKKVVFCTYFRSGGLKTAVEDGKLRIVEEGREVKFVNKVNQITYNGPMAVERKQDVVIVTERAVFELTEEGIVLTEIAPGIDLEKDILALMEFKPVISKDLKEMDPRIFVPGRMGCFD